MSPDQIATALVSLGCGAYVPVFLSVVGAFAAVATRLPPPMPTSGRFYRALYVAVNLAAFNFGHATNATAPLAFAGAHADGGSR